jgi:signal peptidase I
VGTRTSAALRGSVELVLTVAIAIGAAFLIQAFVVKPYKVPTTSMVPTIRRGQRVLVNRLDTHPGLGDIVVFHPPVGANPEPAVCGDSAGGAGHPRACDQPTRRESSQTFIKRVVGLPGDRISIRDGHVIRNGTPEKAPYAQPCPDSDLCTFPDTIGDNRGISDDSRFWGPVPQAWLIGVAVLTYWPPDRIGIF